MTERSHELDLVVTEHGEVRLFTLNRPGRLNAWTPELGRRYLAELDRAASDESVRVLVITGAGRGFCAGYDMDALERVEAESGSGTGVLLKGDPIFRTASFAKPIVAALNGSCAGYGLALALACDVRFAVPEAKITTAYTRLGLAAEDGTSWLLPRLVGRGRAADLLLSARVVNGAEAARFGLVEHLAASDELLPATFSYAKELAERCGPWAMAQVKAQITADADREFAAALAAARVIADAAVCREDFREGTRAFVEREVPTFAPLTAADGDEDHTAPGRRAAPGA